uniref:GRIP domain-containing protein n=1 Tax=Alexandrium catenella TaxID=2925 RepID=A0A7S1WVJ9_ALECA
MQEQERRASEALQEREGQLESSCDSIAHELRAQREEDLERARAVEEALRSEMREQEREGQLTSSSHEVLQELRARHEMELEGLRGAEGALRAELQEQERRAADALQEREGQLESSSAGIVEDLERARNSEEGLRSELQEQERRASEALQEREGQLESSNDGLMQELRAKQELEAEKARSIEETLRSELRALEAQCSDALQDMEKARHAEDATRSELAEQERRALEALEERSRQTESASDGLVQELRERYRQELDAAREGEDALRSKLAEQEQCVAESKEELGQLQSKSEAKIGEIVRKAKDFSRQMQTRLEASVAENRELTEKCKEVDEAHRQQQDEATKYRQLTAVANSKIEDSDRRAKELMDALSRSQMQRTALQEQVASVEKSLSVPPNREELEQRGGIHLAVEGEGDDIWCLLKDGGEAEQDSSSEARSAAANRWWKLSQLEAGEKPVALQKRWRGEVSALRAQMQRFKRKSEEMQEEFDGYKQKANAALQTGATHCEEVQLKSRQVEQLGEQLRAATLDVQRAHEDKAKANEELSETRRRLQETLAKGSELEKVLERRAREGEERCYAEVSSSRSRFEAQREALELKWSENERAYQQELDLRRAQKESLDEEVEGLRAMLTQRGASATGMDQGMDDGAAASGAGAAVAASSSTGPAADAAPELARSPLAVGGQEGQRDAASESGGQSWPRSSPRTFSRADDPEGEDDDAPTTTQQVLPQPDSSYHASVTWQGIVQLRSQVRQLENSLQEERQQHGSTRREREAAKAEIREMNMQQSLSNTVGQRQQMEYIRNVFRKFIETCPVGSAEHEQMIFVLTTFFKFPDDDAKVINKNRQSAKSQGGLWTSLTGWKG